MQNSQLKKGLGIHYTPWRTLHLDHWIKNMDSRNLCTVTCFALREKKNWVIFLWQIILIFTLQIVRKFISETTLINVEKWETVKKAKVIKKNTEKNIKFLWVLRLFVQVMLNYDLKKKLHKYLHWLWCTKIVIFDFHLFFRLNKCYQSAKYIFYIWQHILWGKDCILYTFQTLE